MTSNGTVTVSPPVLLTNSCPLDISDFPFDSKSCVFRFGSWAHDSTRINVSIGNNEVYTYFYMGI